MKKKTKKRITKHVQLKVRTGIKGGQECQSDADCPLGYGCLDNSCYQYIIYCQTQADCPPNWWCDPEEKTCNPGPGGAF